MRTLAVAFLLLGGVSGFRAGLHTLSLCRRSREPVVACSEGPNPDEWREFRARLISSGGFAGLKTTEEDDGGEVAEDGSADIATPPERPAAAAVAPRNAELLKAQNAALWTEYMQGAWAHESPVE
eukprot:6729313-Prymnesium_polylepis.1